MNAADRIWRAGALEVAKLAAQRWTPVVSGALALLVFAYCTGEAHGKEAGRQAVAAETRKALADSSAAIEARIVARAPVLVHQSAIATRERILYRDAAAHVAVVSDTVLRVDTLLVNVPAPVVQVIARCDSTVTADSVTIVAVVAQLHDMTVDRNVWRDRALLDESRRPRAPRFGFKAGAIAGAAVIVAVLRFIR